MIKYAGDSLVLSTELSHPELDEPVDILHIDKIWISIGDLLLTESSPEVSILEGNLLIELSPETSLSLKQRELFTVKIKFADGLVKTLLNKSIYLDRSVLSSVF